MTEEHTKTGRWISRARTDVQVELGKTSKVLQGFDQTLQQNTETIGKHTQTIAKLDTGADGLIRLFSSLPSEDSGPSFEFIGTSIADMAEPLALMKTDVLATVNQQSVPADDAAAEQERCAMSREYRATEGNGRPLKRRRLNAEKENPLTSCRNGRATTPTKQREKKTSKCWGQESPKGRVYLKCTTVTVPDSSMKALQIGHQIEPRNELSSVFVHARIRKEWRPEPAPPRIERLVQTWKIRHEDDEVFRCVRMDDLDGFRKLLIDGEAPLYDCDQNGWNPVRVSMNLPIYTILFAHGILTLMYVRRFQWRIPATKFLDSCIRCTFISSRRISRSFSSINSSLQL
ncbi:hypothetical protein K402DRAFT_208062 [Aulographum hederae CBS 113979]|uniref:Uncharacterized protein n=1 Tax=Aulographum hederae CBS 113979 TaxID=1176131 RepID=A0A6G1GNA7_9PEZI|nr:hypothetical protein K402DRAFT_208062 [Aulographum hederae CBS 113979]